jgi:mannan endo-1,4-beta-mannosidase
MEIRHRAGRWLLIAASLVGMIATPGLAAAGNVGFVQADGTRFALNSAPFYFVGTNAFWMYVSAAWGDRSMTDETMNMANQLGFTVLRTWAFYDGGTDGLALQPSAGVYSEANLQALDYVLDQADRHGVRLLLSLVNGPPDFGGMDQYVRWCAPGQSRLAFYTNATCRQIYQNYVRKIVTRVNTLNGRRYADDPTIFAWELANEPDAPDGSNPSGQAIRDWVRVMAAFVKSLDTNHMVTTGEIGWDITTQGYSPVSTTYKNQAWLFNGWKGTAFTQNSADPNVDFASIHLYPEWWNFDVAGGTAWITDHARITASLNKPLVLGEFGMAQNTATAYSTWLAVVDTENVSGALAWQLMCQACAGMSDQFGVIYPPNTGASDALAHAATLAAAKSGSGSPPPPPPAPAFTATASAAPTTVTAGQTATLALSVTAAAAASSIIVDVEVFNSSGTRVAQQYWTGQGFTAGQTRSYSWPWAVPAGTAASPYTVSVGVYNSTWATRYTWVAAAATVQVQAPAVLSFQATATVSPATVVAGQTATVGVNVTASAAASGIIVDLEVFAANGTRVAQQYWTGQGFTAGQTRSYSYPWAVPAGQAPGPYTMRVGVFNSTWATMYTWVSSAATVQVQAPAVLSFQATVTASPTAVERRQAVTMSSTVTATAAAGNITVDVEIFNSSGTRVAQQVWSGQSFAAGQTRTFNFDWSTSRWGTYTVKIGVFGANWAPMYLWQNQAATFQVQ